MIENEQLLKNRAEDKAVLPDTGEIPKRSRRGDWILTLQAMSIAFILLGLLWAIEYWKNG